ncbi:MAG: PilZ domain-containing protein [Rhodocyclales bacterium]|nr:PilZ domain-containing protein [Rhodocyclales bacterium]
MRHDLRRAERLPLAGMAELIAGDRRLAGNIIDISPKGIAVAVHRDDIARLTPRQTWMCRVVAADLPAPVQFLVRAVRRKERGFGVEVGCEITVIDVKPLGLINAFRALYKARAANFRT